MLKPFIKMFNHNNKDRLYEQELADRLSAGDDLAFSEIYNRYWKRLLAIAYNHTRDKANAEEVVQEVFVSLWNKRHIIHVQSLERYLAKAVKFFVFKEIQRRKRQIEIEETNFATNRVVIGDEIIDAQFLREYINHIVDHLPEKCKLVFKYSRQSGMKINEIAERMGLAEKTVESHLTKALKILRLRLVK
jgi:RNA polymerase sigma-70 factor (family 1)